MHTEKDPIKIIECPRDAMQGLTPFIPTEAKVRYINQLLKVGFDTLDFGSFVSPKAIPQMKDTAAVLEQLELQESQTKLSAIVANRRGAEDACAYTEIDYLGYPFSISETFQLRNTNSTIEQSLDRLKEILDLCIRHNKELLVYISMGFGNPYGDEWNVDVCAKWVGKLSELGVKTFALSDTIGIANDQSITYLFSKLVPMYPELEIGAHFHTTPSTWRDKVDAAFHSGCRRFDGAIKGFGGCPMAKDDLTGNMPTENLIAYFQEKEIDLGIDENEFIAAFSLSNEIFPR